MKTHDTYLVGKPFQAAGSRQQAAGGRQATALWTHRGKRFAAISAPLSATPLPTAVYPE